MIKLAFYQSIRFKLFVFTSLLVATLLTTTAFLDGTFLFRQLLLTKQEQAGNETRMMANQLESVLDSWLSQMLMVTNGLAIGQRENYETIVKAYAKSNTDLVGFYLIPEVKRGTSSPILSVLTEKVDDNRFAELNAQTIHKQSIAQLTSFASSKEAKSSNIKVFNLSGKTKAPIFAIGMPFNTEGSKSRVWAFLTTWQTRMIKSLTKQELGYVVLLDRSLEIYTSNSADTLKNSANLQYRDEIRELRNSKVGSGFKEWKSPDGKQLFGTWTDLGTYGLRLYNISSGEAVYSALVEILKRSVYLAAFVILISILFVYVAAGRTTKSLQALMAGALEIAKGNFLFRTNIRSADEVGILGKVINYMAVELGNLVSTRTEKARLESALDTAKAVQNAYIPNTNTVPVSFRVGAFYQPAETCGGDWWGHFPINEDLHVFAIADATGHGIPAALITAMIYSMVSLAAKTTESQTIETISPADMLEKFNGALCGQGQLKHTLTCFIAVIDSKQGLMKYSSAGHNSPFYYTIPKESKDMIFARKPLKSYGNPLGLMEKSTYKDSMLALQQSDRIILYTDGLTECTNEKGVQYGKYNVQKLLKSIIPKGSKEITDEIIAGAFNHYNGYPLNDDITLVVIDYQGESSEEGLKKWDESA